MRNCLKISQLSERMTRIELATEAWEAAMLPLHHIREKGVSLIKYTVCRNYQPTLNKIR